MRYLVGVSAIYMMMCGAAAIAQWLAETGSLHIPIPEIWTGATILFALIWVLVFTGATLFMLSGVFQWSSAIASLTRRNNQFGSGVAAARR